MWFFNGLLLGVLICCILFIYANVFYRRKPRVLPPERQKVEYKDGTLSIDGCPGYQDIPCRIEIYHTYRYCYNERLRVVEDHTEIRRYCLNLPMPVSMFTQRYGFRITDSDGIKSLVYVGSVNTLVQT